MGQKVNPISWRIKVNGEWRSKWFGRRKFSDLLIEDFRIRKYISEEFKVAGIANVLIDRDANKITVTIKSARPGVIIGKSGIGAIKIKDGVEKIIKNSKVKINIEEVKNPDTVASIIAQNIALQLEKRMPFRRAMKQAVEKAQQSGISGIKISISGRLNGAEIARQEKVTFGLVPLSTIKAVIDYAYSIAKTTYGVIGIKVWVYKGINKTNPLSE
ncbi:MAG: 30S ribosomal protein S3 [Candidatus Berkelbacteria bacterium Athens1014_28]|uniref:Small ribosomal subunit protein uS3 n=1 Tax=Candidatus Berkelbacteria bacterium Athens1014_28 TaxID=2017145 RepID=A0A554LQY7_9BACT|nr:MAG: 30S ribosomal protein S3 [Candidatus Berkelbacteria bacterium Athens1014_28]